MTQSPTPWSGETFDDLFRMTAPRLRSHLRRQVSTDAVDDVLSETYVVAWRRIHDVPDPPLPWLIGVARNLCLKRWASDARANALWREMVARQWQPLISAESQVLDRETALAALAQCTAAEREALLLTAWDGLTPTEAAEAIGCTARAFTVRLSRARARFNQHYLGDPQVEPTAQPPLGLASSTPRLLKEPS